MIDKKFRRRLKSLLPMALLLIGCLTFSYLDKPSQFQRYVIRDTKGQMGKGEQYKAYLGEMTEKILLEEEGIEWAKAKVTYDEGKDQYSIEVDLKTKKGIKKEQVEGYKDFLSKTYIGVTLVIDGEYM